MLLPADLREFQTELAGRLALHDAPGGEVKALRERYGFTQDWLAPLLDLRRESLSRVESGHVALTIKFIQRFTRIVTLARAVREHLAFAEARDNRADENYLDMLAVSLRIDKATADEVILASMMSYERKRKATIRDLGRPARGGGSSPVAG